MMKLFILCCALFFVLSSNGKPIEYELRGSIWNSTTFQVADSDFHTYAKVSAFLKKHVTSTGKVNYAGIKKDMSELNVIVKTFEQNFPKKEWSNNQKLAYWINVYNVYTLKLVAENYPVSSITKITAKPWDKKFIALGGKIYSLGEIENEILRKQFNEPRIHFALNCASKSCPALLNTAYTASSLSTQLSAQTKKFLADMNKNDFSNSKSIRISKIFDWYKVDFTKSGTVIDFINKYRASKLNNPTITYLDYSWDLNE